jgi:hypothetical protein
VALVTSEVEKKEEVVRFVVRQRVNEIVEVINLVGSAGLANLDNV